METESQRLFTQFSVNLLKPVINGLSVASTGTDPMPSQSSVSNAGREITSGWTGISRFYEAYARIDSNFGMSSFTSQDDYNRIVVLVGLFLYGGPLLYFFMNCIPTSTTDSGESHKVCGMKIHDRFGFMLHGTHLLCKVVRFAVYITCLLFANGQSNTALLAMPESLMVIFLAGFGVLGFTELVSLMFVSVPLGKTSGPSYDGKGVKGSDEGCMCTAQIGRQVWNIIHIIVHVAVITLVGSYLGSSADVYDMSTQNDNAHRILVFIMTTELVLVGLYILVCAVSIFAHNRDAQSGYNSPARVVAVWCLFQCSLVGVIAVQIGPDYSISGGCVSRTMYTVVISFLLLYATFELILLRTTAHWRGQHTQLNKHRSVGLWLQETNMIFHWSRETILIMIVAFVVLVENIQLSDTYNPRYIIVAVMMMCVPINAFLANNAIAPGADAGVSPNQGQIDGETRSSIIGRYISVFVNILMLVSCMGAIKPVLYQEGDGMLYFWFTSQTHVEAYFIIPIGIVVVCLFIESTFMVVSNCRLIKNNTDIGQHPQKKKLFYQVATSDEISCSSNTVASIVDRSVPSEYNPFQMGNPIQNGYS